MFAEVFINSIVPPPEAVKVVRFPAGKTKKPAPDGVSRMVPVPRIVPRSCPIELARSNKPVPFNVKTEVLREFPLAFTI